MVEKSEMALEWPHILCDLLKKLFINFDHAGPWLQHVASLLGRLLLLQRAGSLVVAPYVGP